METERLLQVTKTSFHVEASSSRFCAVKNSHMFKRYPPYTNISDDLKTHLRDCGLDQLYSCLEWRWSPFDFIVDFVGHAQIQESPHLEHTIVRYFPHGSGAPISLTLPKVAEIFNLDVLGFCVDKASLKDVNLGDRFQIQKTQLGECYFSVTSAATNALHILARFVIQVIFLSQSSMKGTVISMRHLQVALDGKRVAWGKLLWKYLVKRLQSCQQRDGAKDFYSKLNSSYAGLAAIIGAVLVRLEIKSIPEHEAWYNSLLATLPDCDISDTDYVEILVDDELRDQPMHDGEKTEKKRPAPCVSYGCQSSEPYEDCPVVAQQEEDGSEVEVTVDDDEDGQPNFVEGLPVHSEVTGERTALVVYQSREDDVAAADDRNDSEVERKTKRKRRVSNEVNNVDMSLQGARDSAGAVPLIKWEENGDTIVESSNVLQNSRKGKESSIVREQMEMPIKDKSERTGGKVEDLSGQELLKQFTRLVNDWSKKTSTEKNDNVNQKAMNTMNGRRDILANVSNANKTLENTLKLMEKSVVLKNKSIQEKYEAFHYLIQGRKESKGVEQQEQIPKEETQNVLPDVAKQRYYENVVNADLKFDIMNFKKEIKLMDLYLHVNIIKLEEREVKVKPMLDGIRILMDTLESLEGKLLKDILFEEIKQLLNMKTFILNNVVEEIRNLKEVLKLWQEKLENEVDLLELKDE